MDTISERGSRRKRLDEREQLWLDNHLRALRHALWIALLAGQDLGLPEIQGQITSLLVYVDSVQEHLEDLQDELVDIELTFGPEVRAEAARQRLIDLR